MDRTVFYKSVVTDGTPELDYLYNSLAKFFSIQQYDPGYYRVVQEDIYRPDLISYKNYSTVEYWWIIMFVNNINDPFYDLTVGMELSIPNVLDVYTFFKKYGVQ